MKHIILRRKYRVLLLILVTGTIYLLFQLFSFKVLNFSAHQDLKFVAHRGGVVIGDDPLLVNNNNGNDNNDILKFKPSGKDSDFSKGEGMLDKEDTGVKDMQEANEEQSENTGVLKLPKGVHIMQSEDYKHRKDGMFQCLETKEMISYSSVNDDYCDCKDSSDEPGTSACPQSMFYCTFQYPDTEPQHVSGIRVNDGVCDCCDGSDEWQNVTVMAGVQLTDKRMKGSLTHSPCKDTCAAVLTSNAEDVKIRELGRRLKQSYIDAGKQAPKNDIYGPDGVFYQLGLSCFDHEEGDYKYSLCPFKSVTQQKFPQAATNIGKSPVWKIKVQDHGLYVLKMDKGDVSGCPGGKFRNTVITFICGLSDRILKVSEDERCTYSMKFVTPAAC